MFGSHRRSDDGRYASCRRSVWRRQNVLAASRQVCARDEKKQVNYLTPFMEEEKNVLQVQRLQISR